jgi:hypothetical protein
MRLKKPVHGNKYSIDDEPSTSIAYSWGIPGIRRTREITVFNLSYRKTKFLLRRYIEHTSRCGGRCVNDEAQKTVSAINLLDLQCIENIRE